VRLPFLACGGLAVLFAALTARELSDDPRAPGYAALLAAAAPLLHVTGMLALPDAPLEAAYAAAVWLLARARGRRWVWAGVAVGLALLAKYSAALLAPALLLLVLWDGELRRELRTPWPWLGAAVAVAIFLPTLLWDGRRGFPSIGFQLAHGFREGATLRSFAEFVGGQLGGAGPVLLVAGLAGLLRPRGSAWRRVAAATLVPLAVTLYSAMRGEAEVNWTVHAFPSLAAAAGAWLAGRRAGRPLVAVSVALGAVAALALAWVQRDSRFAGDSVHDRFTGWHAFAAEARAGAAAACAEAGLACDLDDPFVYAANYRIAGQIAYYGGWSRLGRGIGRRSQLDLWDEAPRPGEPVVVVADSPETLDDFRARARATQVGAERPFEVRGANGKLVRRGRVAVFTGFAGVHFRD
jgi:hypothetical protein